MTVNFYANNSPNNYLNKNLTLVDTVENVNIKDNTDLSNPILEMLGVIPTAVNYAYVYEWKRYYYINNTQMTQYATTLINMHCDVLTSFKEEILQNNALILSNPTLAHPYIQQEPLSLVKPIITIKKFNNSFNETATNFVMAVVG